MLLFRLSLLLLLSLTDYSFAIVKRERLQPQKVKNNDIFSVDPKLWRVLLETKRVSDSVRDRDGRYDDNLDHPSRVCSQYESTLAHWCLGWHP